MLLLLLACDGSEPEPAVDADGDGYSITDCDDQDAAAFPGAEEVCDGVDNDCNGEVDELGGMTLHADADGDGYGDPAVSATWCEPGAGWVGNFDDCDDTSADNHPGADEVCDDLDNDCDGQIDDEDDELTVGDWSFDTDGDGYGGDLMPQRCSYEEGYVLEGGDCDDEDAALSPGADEVCDGIDNDCDGLIDDEDEDAVDALFYYPDLDGDGYGDEDLPTFSCAALSGQIVEGGDCDDADADINPGTTEYIGNGIDDNCNDLQDERLLADAVLTWTAVYETDAVGTSLAGVGDVDGDGRDDVLIGAPGNDAEGEDAGAAFLVRGGAVPGSTASLTETWARIGGEQYGDRSGEAVSGAGDVNGDGYDDILVGAPYRGSDAGTAYLLLGPISGDLELDDADYLFTGENTGDRAGMALSAAGDVDGDGLSDFLVGAPGLIGDAGRAYLITDEDLRSGSLSGATARVSGRSDERLGSALSAGDFDGDGHADLLIGAPASEDGDFFAGSVHIFLASELSVGMSVTEDDASIEGEDHYDQLGTAVAGSGDLNRDGYDDILAGAPEDDNGHIDGGGVMLIYGSASISGPLSEDARLLGGFYRELVGSSLSIVGDTDGDGRDDVLIGAPGNDTSGTNAGAVYFVSGAGLSGTVSLPDAAEILVGGSAGDQAGASVAGAGDFDADGRADLLIGAPGESTTWSDGGAAILFLGSAVQ